MSESINPKADVPPPDDAAEGDVEQLMEGAAPIRPLDDNNNNKNNYTKPK